MNGEQCQPAPESPFLIECIRAWYRAQAVSLHRLPSDAGKYIYQVKLTDGTLWILRVVADMGKASVIELAHLLIFFEQQKYPAERIVLTVEQITLATVGGWHLLMTTFLVGTPLEYAPPSFLSLGAIVGRLHALSSSLTYTPPRAQMHPTGELAFAQQQLDAIASLVPRLYITQYDWLENALSSIDRGTHLPDSLIHADCHPANALLTPSEQAVLFDWDDAGMGPAVLDVGFLLANCDGKAPWDPLSPGPFHPNEALLQAVIEGYCHYHRLSPEELDYLPDAIRFRSLVFGACQFASAIAQQQNAEFNQWWWRRYSAAEEISERARACFEHVLP